MLTIHSFTKLFGSTTAVNNVSFSIKDGEIFSLIGPNSSGKSTIVKSIVGLLEPTKGSIEINGINITSSPEQAKKHIGYIPDEPSVWPYMTGKEFLHFTKALFRDKKIKKEEPIISLLSLFNLEGTEGRYFDEYSRGNKQKFSILAALSHSPSLLLIDEPIVGLDPIGADIAKKLFVEHAKKGGSVLLVTHTLPVAEEISDRIGILKNGSLIATGTMVELREKANLKSDASLEEVYKALAQ